MHDSPNSDPDSDQHAAADPAAPVDEQLARLIAEWPGLSIEQRNLIMLAAALPVNIG